MHEIFIKITGLIYSNSDDNFLWISESPGWVNKNEQMKHYEEEKDQ